jgi:hypothetical protein
MYKAIGCHFASVARAAGAGDLGRVGRSGLVAGGSDQFDGSNGFSKEAGANGSGADKSGSGSRSGTAGGGNGGATRGCRGLASGGLGDTTGGGGAAGVLAAGGGGGGIEAGATGAATAATVFTTGMSAAAVACTLVTGALARSTSLRRRGRLTDGGSVGERLVSPAVPIVSAAASAGTGWTALQLGQRICLPTISGLIFRLVPQLHRRVLIGFALKPASLTINRACFECNHDIQVFSLH